MTAEIAHLHGKKKFTIKSEFSAQGWLSVWTFNTAQCLVALEVKPRECTPGPDFDYQHEGAGDDHGGDCLEWFSARVAIYKRGRPIGYSMGGTFECKAPTVRHFYTQHRHPNPMQRNCSIRRAKHGDTAAIRQTFALLVRDAIDEARLVMGTSRTGKAEVVALAQG